MNKARYLTVLGAALFPLVVALASNSGCKKDETEPAPSATPAPTPTPTPPPVATVTPEEDAGSDADAADGDGSDGKVVVGVSGLTKCCNAIKQNQKSAPPDQQLLYGAAISLCNSGVIPPQFRNLPQCK
jgi:hypothetical protein